MLEQWSPMYVFTIDKRSVVERILCEILRLFIWSQIPNAGFDVLKGHEAPLTLWNGECVKEHEQ